MIARIRRFFQRQKSGDFVPRMRDVRRDGLADKQQAIRELRAIKRAREVDGLYCRVTVPPEGKS